MKKFFLISLAAVVVIAIVAGGVGYYYLESIVSSMVKTTLESQYGVAVEFDGLSVNPATRAVHLENPKFYDAENRESGALLQAKSISIWGEIGGEERIKVNRFRAEGLVFELIRQADGVLPVANVLSRFLPNVNWSEALNIELLPSGEQQAKRTLFVAQLGVIDYDIPAMALELNDSWIKRGSREQPFIAIGELNADNLGSGEPLKATGDSLSIEAIETGQDRYDFNTALDAIDKLAENFASTEPSEPMKIGSLSFDSIDLTILPNSEEIAEAGSLKISAQSVNLDSSGLRLGAPELIEGNQPLFKAGELNLPGFTLDAPMPKSIQAKDPALQLATRNDSLNLDRALKRIESLQRSMGPAEDNGGETFSMADLALDIANASVKHTIDGSEGVSVEFASLKHGDGLNLSGLNISEAGQPLAQSDSIELGGYQLGGTSIESIAVAKPLVSIRENESGSLNLARAINQVNSLIETLAPASGDNASGETLNWSSASMNIQTVKATYVTPSSPEQTITIDSIQLDPAAQSATLKALSYHPPLPDGQAGFDIPQIEAMVDPSSNFQSFELIDVQNLKLDGWFDMVQAQPFDALALWNSLPSKLNEELGVESSGGDPVRIRQLKLTGASLTFDDRRMPEPVKHVWSPIDMTWEDYLAGAESAPMSPFTLNAMFEAPSAGSVTLSGRLSPVFSPLNSDLQADAVINDLIAYRPYYEAAMPVNLDSGGLKISGAIPIRDNQLDALLDVTMVQPAFSSFDETFTQQFQANMAVTVLEDLKNADGDIVFNDNKITGDVTDPQFAPGISVFAVIGNSLLKRIINIPGMLTDPVGTTKAILEGTAGAAGGVLGGVGEGLKSLFGGGGNTEEASPDGSGGN